MKIKFDNYVCSHFNQQNMLFDTNNGILYYKNKSNKLQEIPNQYRNLVKLKKILDNHPDNDDYQRIVFSKEIKHIQKQITKRRKMNEKKTKKRVLFHFF